MPSQQQMSAEGATSEQFTWIRATMTTLEISASELPAWQADAIAAYMIEARAGDTHLRAELCARVHDLTGCSISDSAITVNCEACRATATLDGVVFQLQGHDLILLQPCAYCGTGRFKSPPVCGRADLGYSLVGWHPYHPGCEPADPSE